MVRQSRTKIIVAAVMNCVALAGCGGGTDVTGSVPLRYDERHPIVVGNAPTIVDIYMGAGGFDGPAINRIRGFALLHHEKNGGPIDINFPRAAADSPRLKPIVEQIEKIFADNQITANVSVRFYEPNDNRNLAPIRLSFMALSAAVPHACGSYSQDLINTPTRIDNNNQNYYDFGCATQSFIASQVSNPADLKSPRAESNSDIVMRTRAIGKIRDGSDPSSSWSVTNTGVN
jgi:pilus assembly protein CpaD